MSKNNPTPIPPSDYEKRNQTLVPEHIKNLTPYKAGKPIAELAREKNLTRITKLASNENPLGPSPLALKEIKNHTQHIHRYPDMNAFELKESLANKYHLKHNNIILGNGSEGIMSLLMRTFIKPGDEILTSECSFIGFTILARSVGVHLTTVPMRTDNSHTFDIQAIKNKITPKTKLIYIANPNNPTGTRLTKEEFDDLMQATPFFTLVILDEAYFEYAQDLPSFPDSMNYRYDNVITLRTFSKIYGLAGLRIGYGFAHEDLISNLHKVKLPFEPNSLAQAAARACLLDKDHLSQTLLNNKKEFNRLYDFLKKENFAQIINHEPCTNFITIKFDSAALAKKYCDDLLNFGVIIRHLVSNEMPAYARISIGLPHEMDHYYEAHAQL